MCLAKVTLPRNKPTPVILPWSCRYLTYTIQKVWSVQPYNMV